MNDMEGAISVGRNLQQIDQTSDEELDCFWLMWDNDGWVAKLPSPRTLPPMQGYFKHISFLPPIDDRPLVARNQFVSQRCLQDIMSIMQEENPSPSAYPQNHYFENDSPSLIEETIRSIHGKTINEILPEPQQADYIDLMEPERRPSYQTTLKMFAMGEEKKNAGKEKGYSSRHFWRSFLGSHYTCMTVNCNLLQK